MKDFLAMGHLRFAIERKNPLSWTKHLKEAIAGNLVKATSAVAVKHVSMRFSSKISTSHFPHFVELATLIKLPKRIKDS